MIRSFVIILICSIGFNTCFSAGKKDDAGITRLHKNLIENLLNDKQSEDKIYESLSQLKEDGSFSDIDYADKTSGGWLTYKHLGRLLNMAILYKSPKSANYNNPETKKQIFKVLDYWLSNDFINPNWWYPEIGVPKLIGQAMILLQDELSPEELQSGLKILNRSTIKHTGQNKVWLSGNVVYRSLLTRDSEMINKAAKSIAEEIAVTENEGIQPDFSFHQHGHQQQFGNYGLSFAGDMVKWASIFEGTEFAFNENKIKILRNYLRDGLKWIVWNNRFDISGCGRQLFPNAQIGKALTVAGIFSEAQAADPSFANNYKTDLNPFEGNKHFWRSDMTVHRRTGFYASVKMSSRRVKGYEIINGENIQGYHMGDGATCFYQSGDEYLDIFPFWDWKKIPGITAFQDQEKLPQKNELLNRSDFVGGVSDGMNGIAAMKYNRDSLTANKSWFFFNDAIICLGSGIKAQISKDVVTSVNQSFLKGEVQVSLNGKTSSLEKGLHDLNKVNWVIQDQWGYYFPGSLTLRLENQQRSGAWTRVAAYMSPKELTTDIFQLWIDHEVKPTNASYSYYILPSATRANIQKRANELKIIANKEDLQAVTTKNGKLSGVVFYRPGSCQIENGMKISSDTPCLVLISGNKTNIQLSVSDPTHLQKSIKLTLSGKYMSKEPGFASFDSAKNITAFSISLPTKGDAGKSITFDLRQ
jgi:chondroitin AC lyase